MPASASSIAARSPAPPVPITNTVVARRFSVIATFAPILGFVTEYDRLTPLFVTAGPMTQCLGAPTSRDGQRTRPTPAYCCWATQSAKRISPIRASAPGSRVAS